MKRFLAVLLVAVLALFTVTTVPVNAEEAEKVTSITLEQAVVSLQLDPGETHNGQFEVTNSGDLMFDMTVTPEFFTPGAINGDRFTTEGRFTEIHKWIKLPKTEYKRVMPGETVTVRYTIEVPLDAPAGGQYAGINVTVGGGEVDKDKMGVAVARQLQYRIYATVAGDTDNRGFVSAYDIPGWVKSGDLMTSLAIKNEGNTDFTALSYLTVKTLFGKEVYKTPEDARSATFVFPETESEVVELAMVEPKIGIYRVTQSTLLTGRTIENSEWVIVAPVWLVIVVVIGLLAALTLGIMFLVRAIMLERGRKAAVEKKTT